MQRRGRTRMHHPPALLALCLAVASACDVADDAVDVAVAERSVNALSANTNLALVAERFAGEPAMAAMSVDAARTRAVELVAQRVGALALLSCDPQVTADPVAGTVHAMVADCRIGPVRLDGGSTAASRSRPPRATPASAPARWCGRWTTSTCRSAPICWRTAARTSSGR
ncbi:MAG: hypothetical protein IPK74_00230 [Deltaproteobacteria bacterium]|nr:hypothetical protein [Deltaproteobacteria bacterium]